MKLVLTNDRRLDTLGVELMNKTIIRTTTGKFIFFISLLSLLFSCAGTQENKKSSVKPPGQEVREKPEPEKVPEKPEPPKEKEKKEEPEAEKSYKMDEKEYKETKKDLSELVSQLNGIIASRNYSKWLTYLTKEYKEYYSDPAVLQKLSEAAVLRKYNIVLRSLKDYFNYVVVQSRRNIQVDDIKAISKGKVKAYMYKDDNPEEKLVVYTLEKVDDEWKITK